MNWAYSIVILLGAAGVGSAHANSLPLKCSFKGSIAVHTQLMGGFVSFVNPGEGTYECRYENEAAQAINAIVGLRYVGQTSFGAGIHVSPEDDSACEISIVEFEIGSTDVLNGGRFSFRDGAFRHENSASFAIAVDDSSCAPQAAQALREYMDSGATFTFYLKE